MTYSFIVAGWDRDTTRVAFHATKLLTFVLDEEFGVCVIDNNSGLVPIVVVVVATLNSHLYLNCSSSSSSTLWNERTKTLEKPFPFSTKRSQRRIHFFDTLKKIFFSNFGVLWKTCLLLLLLVQEIMTNKVSWGRYECEVKPTTCCVLLLWCRPNRNRKWTSLVDTINKTTIKRWIEIRRSFYN